MCSGARNKDSSIDVILQFSYGPGAKLGLQVVLPVTITAH